MFRLVLGLLVASVGSSGETGVDDWEGGRPYVVFDESVYTGDVSPVLLAFLDSEGFAPLETLEPSLRLIEFKVEAATGLKEGRFSYYKRVCAELPQVCTSWLAQSFAGFTLGELEQHVHAMMERDEISVKVLGRESPVLLYPPKIDENLKFLFETWAAQKIEVFVITSELEELTRLIITDEANGLKVPESHVFGTSLLLKDPAGLQAPTSSRLKIRQGGTQADLKDFKITPFMMAPMSGAEKLSTVFGWADLWAKPRLAAGHDPAEDGLLLLSGVDVEDSVRMGVRLWFNQNQTKTDQMIQWRLRGVSQQAALNQPLTADSNWVQYQPVADFAQKDKKKKKWFLF